MDPDRAGKAATERITAMLEAFGNRPGLLVEIITMPEGTGDPDEYVRKFSSLQAGVEELRKLTRVDLFSWNLKRNIREGANPAAVCEEQLKLIVNEPNNIQRVVKADQLAEATGISKDFVRRELNRLLDQDQINIEEQKTAIANDIATQIRNNPKAIASILSTAASRIEAIEGKKIGYDPLISLQKTEATFADLEAMNDPFEIVTGYPIFDSLAGGIAREGCSASLPGKPHHGKSIWLDNLIVRCLQFNPNAMFFMHHVDDSTGMRLPRLMGILSGLPSREIQKAGANLDGEETEFQQKYLAAKNQILEWQRDERLILADQSVLSNSLLATESWIKSLRARYPKRDFVVIGDNFHLFDMPTSSQGPEKVRELSRFVSNLSTVHELTTLFTIKIPSTVLKSGIRPSYIDSKGSGGLAFDSKLNMNVYQQMSDNLQTASLVWHDPAHLEETVLENGSVGMQEKDLPIVEIIVDKNKVTGLKRTIFFKLEPMSGQMTECTQEEQVAYAKQLYLQKNPELPAASQQGSR